MQCWRHVMLSYRGLPGLYVCLPPPSGEAVGACRRDDVVRICPFPRTPAHPVKRRDHKNNDNVSRNFNPPGHLCITWSISYISPENQQDRYRKQQTSKRLLLLTRSTTGSPSY